MTNLFSWSDKIVGWAIALIVVAYYGAWGFGLIFGSLLLWVMGTMSDTPGTVVIGCFSASIGLVVLMFTLRAPKRKAQMLVLKALFREMDCDGKRLPLWGNRNLLAVAFDNGKYGVEWRIRPEKLRYIDFQRLWTAYLSLNDVPEKERDKYWRSPTGAIIKLHDDETALKYHARRSLYWCEHGRWASTRNRCIQVFESAQDAQREVRRLRHRVRPELKSAGIGALVVLILPAVPPVIVALGQRLAEMVR